MLATHKVVSCTEIIHDRKFLRFEWETFNPELSSVEKIQEIKRCIKKVCRIFL